MPSRLTRDDLAQLTAAPTEDKRIDIASRVVDMVRYGGLSAEESALADDILRLMAQDAALKVRAAFAEIVGSVPDIPKDVVLSLADDFERVALPVLRHSPVLSEQELIDLVRRGSPQKQKAIAERAEVSEAVAETIVDVAGEEPVSALMGNPGASLTPVIMGKALDRFPDSETIAEGIAMRPHLPVTVAERLVAVVSGRLKEYLLSRPDLSEPLAKVVTEHSRARATLSLLDTYGRGRNIPLIVRQLAQAGRLTPTLVLRAACTGDMAFVETALGELSGFDTLEVWRRVHHTDDGAFDELVSKAGLTPSVVPVLKTAFDVYQTMDFDGEPMDWERFRTRMIERVLTQCPEMETDDINYLLLKVDQLSQKTLAA